MTTKTNSKAVTKAEIDAAVEQEKPVGAKATKPVSASLFKKIQRVHELKRLMAPMLAEIEEIKGSAFKEMDNKNVNILTRKGVEVVSRDTANSRSTNMDALFKDYPEIYSSYVTTKEIKKINWKNPVE